MIVYKDIISFLRRCKIIKLLQITKIYHNIHTTRPRKWAVFSKIAEKN